MSRTGVASPTTASRTWRGATLGLAGWYMVVVSHGFVSGSLPSVGAVLATGFLAALVGVGLAGRRWTWRRAFLALLLLQPTLHLALSALASGHHHAAAGSSGGWPMVIAHVVAAAGAALVISRGEHALDVLATLLVSVLRRITPRQALAPLWADASLLTSGDGWCPSYGVRWSVQLRGPPLRQSAR
jgi:hypothetical protein